MPKLSELQKRNALRTWNLHGTREGVWKLFHCKIIEVLDYMMTPIVGLQNILLVEKHEMRLLDSVDMLARFARPPHQQR